MKKCYIIGFLTLTMINIGTIVGCGVAFSKKEQHITMLNERVLDIQKTCYIYEEEINILYNKLDKNN